MKQRHFLLSIIAFSTGLILNASPVYFGAGGLVKRKSAAVAELLPWKAQDERLVLAGEQIEYLGDGAYSVTRSVKNTGIETVSFKDEIRVRDRKSVV